MAARRAERAAAFEREERQAAESLALTLATQARVRARQAEAMEAVRARAHRTAVEEGDE